MGIYRPPVTGDPEMDSFLHYMAQDVNALSQSNVASGGNGVVGADGAPGTDGVNAATLVLFKRQDTTNPNDVTDIVTETLYNYQDNTLVASANPAVTEFDGWQRTYPADTEGRGLFAIQVNIADANATEVIPASSWSDPILLLDRGPGVIQVRIATNNGTALRLPNDTTTLKAIVSIDNEDQSDAVHNGYKYEWTDGATVVCVDSSRNVINDGEGPLLATGSGSGLVCSIGTPASNEAAADIHGSTLREITISPEDVDKRQLFDVKVTDI